MIFSSLSLFAVCLCPIQFLSYLPPIMLLYQLITFSLVNHRRSSIPLPCHFPRLARQRLPTNPLPHRSSHEAKSLEATYQRVCASRQRHSFVPSDIGYPDDGATRRHGAFGEAMADPSGFRRLEGGEDMAGGQRWRGRY